MALSGLPAALGSGRSKSNQYLTVALFALGSLLGLAGTTWALMQPQAPFLMLPWALPWGQFTVAIDPLSAFFLLLVFSLPLLGAVYSLGYWKQADHPENGRRLGLFYGLLVAAMAMVVMARDAVLFLLVWEIMAVAAYFAASVEDGREEVRQAGWVYLVATHVGTLFLLTMFALWHRMTGSFALELSGNVSVKTAGLIFLFSLVGFGFKAGLMPLHVWLPGAHANAPSHVSALMSGVMLKMGIYGLLRMTALLPFCQPWWGTTLLVVGGGSALLGIAFAMGQRDLKRILAYSSIENIGIIAMGLGIALLGKAYALPALTLLGLGGALYHVWNHGLFKSLLFLNSGAIIHATGTRDIEAMGGLSKRMPQAALLFTVGAVAISALPPLNGFAGEWLIYMGMFGTLSSPGVPNLALAAIAAVVLAMVGALALAVFVRLSSVVFLGSPRSSAGSQAHDVHGAMKGPMVLLALLCLLLGLWPSLVAPLLDGAVRAWAPGMAFDRTLPQLVPQQWISWMGLGLLFLLGLGYVWYRTSVRKRGAVAGRPTWDCGYGQPKATMQYTGASLGQFMVKLFAFALAPSASPVRIRMPFPKTTRFDAAVVDRVLERWVLPLLARANRILPRVYIFQQGQTHVYVLYVVIFTALLFFLGFSGVVR